ncbi:AraC family transcriptional regulator [Muricauda oceani]|uniref:Helix-turn-helix transcriptional regulator n=1 Tax=Flagellimonas oceani TaxID=2698672 RepID=A0A6G7IY21_9FLAO|nr:AraC family transcriptional regulator [Allomuricauda oceani]MBW8244376.1 AraC family transcriptional regulator [Allomuricauda oceani]QII43214.1 helix-turn-helix transcriptional regulator [Allomuricauda oceani]
MEATFTLRDFYGKLGLPIPENIGKDIGHFNVFNIAEYRTRLSKGEMRYDRRAYFKISLINGKNRAEYADKVIDIDNKALLFASPRIPYNYVPQNDEQSGYFCVFTDNFLSKDKSGVILETLPIFHPGGYPILNISDEDYIALEQVFQKMDKELSSDYPFKFDLIRAYVIELLHMGQKLHPVKAQENTRNAAIRITDMFVELLERQFPVNTPARPLMLKTANDFAERLAIHPNHLNKVLKETTGSTTTEVIHARIFEEAKILLNSTDWNISEIAYSLGFEEVAHFSNFFKKHVQLSPLKFRSAVKI